ncbi:hypothetical protein PanWU01x14_336290, partial [Parasponia andersonii]
LLVERSRSSHRPPLCPTIDQRRLHALPGSHAAYPWSVAIAASPKNVVRGREEILIADAVSYRFRSHSWARWIRLVDRNLNV